MSVPISAITQAAAVLPTPSTSSSWSTAAANGVDQLLYLDVQSGDVAVDRIDPVFARRVTCRVRLIPLTATMTATAAATGHQQRPATAHNARTMRTNWDYVRPEKRKLSTPRLH
jgi:hypothetical protein